jgi:hypothetical protein
LITLRSLKTVLPATRIRSLVGSHSSLTCADAEPQHAPVSGLPDGDHLDVHRATPDADAPDGLAATVSDLAELDVPEDRLGRAVDRDAVGPADAARGPLAAITIGSPSHSHRARATSLARPDV